MALFRSYGVLAARILVGAMFIIAGYSKLADASGTASFMASAANLPENTMLAMAVGLFELILGAAVVLGFKLRESALLLALFTILVSFLFHGPGVWESAPIQQTLFYKNMAILAGLLYMVAYGAGDAWKLGASRTETRAGLAS